uniref:ATP-dependent Clp protease proteolytic subunit n=1 Tax=Geranium phaeum TaxID=379952 RepID=A0A165TVM9_9ROSI|nr:ATP-dependent Clp protease proteolytic subunit [Geranium phaeum]
MPVSVPKTLVPYDDENNIPLRYHYQRTKKRRVHEDIFGELFNADSDNDYCEAYDSESKLYDHFDFVQEPYKARVDNDDDDDDASDSPYEVAQKIKKREEEGEEEGEKEGEDTWKGLLEVLNREGLIFIGQEITMKLANSVISLMVYLDQEDKHDQHTTMFINSPGGSILGGLAIYDTIDLVRGKEVQTIAVGIAASIASVVLIGGGLRVAFNTARVMIHQPRMKAFEDESTEIAREVGVLLDLRNSITEIYVRKTGRTYMSITRDLEVDKFLTAMQARAYGIVDAVAPKKSDDSILDLIFS